MSDAAENDQGAPGAGPGRALRIVHCFRSPVGGIFRHVRDLTEAQAAAGHQVGIVCDSSTGGDYEARLFERIEKNLALGVWRTPMQRHIGIGDAAAAWRAFRLIGELRPDVLHGHGAKGGVYSRMFGTLFRASRSRVARVYSPHGGSLHYDGNTATGRLFFWLEGAMARVTDELLFVSEHEFATYLEKVGKPPGRHHVIHNGLRPEEFEPVAAKPDASDFLFVGMMRDLKGPDLFIEALGRAAAVLGRRLSATMVGAGDDLPRYRRQAAALPRIDVEFLDPMPARQAFALGKALVVPSRAEAMPYIVLEALAAGVTIIASAVGGIPEVLGAASPALTRPDAGDIAARMVEACRDPAGFAAHMPPRETLQARFSARAMADAIERAYAEALA